MAVQTRDVPLPQKKRIAGEVRETLWALRPSEELREIVLEASRGMPGCRAVRLPDELSAPSGDSARYGSLSDKGIDTVLEISVPGMGLEGTGGGRSPNLVFFIQTRIRLIRVADGIDLGAPGMDYRGEPHPFPDWAAHTSTMLEEEYEIAVRRTGERIATEVLCPPAAGERAEDPAPPEETGPGGRRVRASAPWGRREGEDGGDAPRPPRRPAPARAIASSPPARRRCPSSCSRRSRRAPSAPARGP